MTTDKNQSHSTAYAQAGVDITAGYRAVELMKDHLARTNRPGVLSSIGGFGGLFQLPKGYEEPVLVSGTDGVGTKLKLAFDMDTHNTIGIDAVAMCVNDIICLGAEPLFFLDYIACGKNDPDRIASIVEGVAEGCVQSGAGLIGGETAEMPGFYPEDEYDIAGFAVGIVEKSKIPNPEDIQEGDVLLALPSTGLHSNGFSLVRKILADREISLDDPFPVEDILAKGPGNLGGSFLDLNLAGKTVGQVLLEPTKIYVKEVLDVFKKVAVRSVANITGGGFYENIPRSLPDGLGALIRREAIQVHPVFPYLQDLGGVDDHDMFNTFNLGVGMVLVLPEDSADQAQAILKEDGLAAYRLGKVVRSEERVAFE